MNMKMTVIPVVNGVLGTDNLRKMVEEVIIMKRIRTIRTISLLKTEGVMKRVLDY